MKKILFLILLSLSFSQTKKLALNSATLDELYDLPISPQLAELLYDYVVYQGPVTNIYDLMILPQMTSESLAILKEYTSTNEVKSVGANRFQEFSRKVESFTGTEGVNEGLVEMWLDRLAEPVNINEATYDDLIALQNVSPVDAVAVLRRIDEGSISYQRALRGALGLSYYGYRNMRDFFTYDTINSKKSNHFWYNTTYKTIPSTNSFDGDANASKEMTQNYRNHPGDVQHKLIFNYGDHWKFGALYHRHLGEENRTTKIGNWDIPEIKASVSMNDFEMGPVSVDRLILGNYSVTMGQGVVFESTDFFAPRRSGYGWSRRVVGAFPDVSRSFEYALNGLAIQSQIGKIQAIGFISRNNRDAVINKLDGSFSSLITMYPRSNFISYTDIIDTSGNTVTIIDHHNVKNRLEEVTYGTHLRLFQDHDFIIGFSAYESLYDRELNPQIQRTIIANANEWRFLQSIGNTADTEIAAMYASSGESPIWAKAKSFRRVYGMDFTKVISNIAFQGEIGVLDKDGDLTTSKNDPRAMVFSSYLQFNNLNFLVLYRDYDLGYDNPYQRSFSNYQRYKGTIFEDTFYLEVPEFGYLYSGSSQPQAERGVFLSSRYQFHRQAVLTTDFDTWTRVADNARYYRTVVRLQYRPTFNFRINIRQKWQQRGAHNSYDPSAFYSRESIVRAQLRLSRFDQVELIYMRANVDFTSRRRLSIDYESSGEELALVGNKNSPSHALGFRVLHNFRNDSKISFRTLVYDGFVWSFEETDFRIFDSLSDAMRWYVAYSSRIGQNWMLRIKWTNDQSTAITNYYYEGADVPVNQRVPWGNVMGINESGDLRVQIDYNL
ncbi:MAG: hypothetical protein HQ510_03360 [Candidatus Marinimicrobia bacterium]|nr:hypothetical protein [Candidatus Neomarinimicrobiota bacterium]